MPRQHVRILALRCTAILLVILIVPVIWQLMLWLPWQVDCLLAIAASFAFAYTFEREESH